MTDQTRSGTAFGPYRLGRLIGRGGMGEVYEARDTLRERIVALKLLPSALAEDANYRTRFEREARLAGMLSDPHVIPIHDFGEIDGVLYIDMRLVRGSDLSEILRRDGRLTPQRAVAIVRQVAGALDEAHRSGLVHRDVKPANIMLTGDDFAYLADFGIATRDTDDRITDDGNAVGSFAYMAPERFEGHQATPRSDVYSLAATFHELITAAPPFPGRSISELVRAHLFEPPASVTAYDVDGAYDTALQRALAKDPHDRYATAGDFATALTSVATTGSSAVGVTSQAEAETPANDTLRHRSTALPMAIIIVAAMVLAGVGIFAYLRKDSPTDAGTATSRSASLGSSGSSSGSSGPASLGRTVSFSSSTGFTGCTMNASSGVTCVSFRRNYNPPATARSGCGWSVQLGNGSPEFVCDPTSFPNDSDNGRSFGASSQHSTAIGTYPVLAVGQAAATGPYVCSMTSDYVTCRNSLTGSGFRIAGSSYRLTP
ncbi:serine/threonine-protein kinase [Calidifontibacter terrae]